ncbi:alpha-galactosidase [Altererythrobacter sp. BO-6]|uniref:alpha-galactosidase n=1 Tax=Altererythrobacter sp. BO-6 TaxID=2604537 RepID=UPI0013E19CCF|nr:alpha-galactosidase [Altererythrobacter sp. BO-6]QIG53453.1 alpha-galactosidase [Altererythrobacter sp. BO-6]
MANEISDEAVILRAGGAMIMLAAAGGERARLLYAGPDLPEATPPQLRALGQRSHAPGGPESPITASFLNTIGTGHPSPPGLLAHAMGQHWALDPRVVEVHFDDDGACAIVTRDEASSIELHHTISLDPASGVATFSSSLANGSDNPIALEWLSALCLPLDARLTLLTSFTGRWASEFQAERNELWRGSFLRENRKGRTSHDSYPGFYLGTGTTSEEHGLACAVHLAWSGNHRLRVDRLPDGDLSLQAGELLLPGEIALAPGETYTTPQLHACWSNEGYGDVTRRLLGFVRSRLPAHGKPRPVHFNTWEAVYFDHSPEKLMMLADQAAAVGAERFVLDDGWFGARRSDRAGLGDWFVSEEIYPDGLKPLAGHVRALGMEFGLWFEPEMVNADSDLYRAHPDWVLGVEGVEPIASRHQLPLDLTREEVADYLFERIDALVRELGIAYIKWDMNRDLQHPGDAEGRPTVHRQTQALYALIDRLRAAHPALVIESCSSGGARADYAMLQRTDRVWTSDNNDARQRHAIMRGAAHFLPLSVLGNHVGPRRCHITGRRFDMAFRAGTALFGHMGMELDLARESEADRATLAAAIALHKRHRTLIHGGDYHRLDTAPHLSAIGVVDVDRREALYQCAVLDQHPATHPPRLYFAGLDPSLDYELALVWPEAMARNFGTYSGSALSRHGLQLPLTLPDTCLIYHLKAED